MATTTLSLPVTKWAYVDETTPATHYGIGQTQQVEISGTTADYKRKRLYFGFSAFPSSLKHNLLYRVELTLPFKFQEYSYASKGYVEIAEDDFDDSTVTWRTAPELSGDSIYFPQNSNQMGEAVWQDISAALSTNVNERDRLLSLLTTHTFAAICDRYAQIYTYWSRPSLIGGTLPVITVTYDDTLTSTSQVYYRSGPNGGYSDPRNPITVGWQLSVGNAVFCLDNNFTQTSATVYWKETGDANWTSIAVAGATNSYTFPANTFPVSSSIEWYIEATDDDGNTTQTAVYTFSTADGASVATPVSPIGTIEKGNQPITFEWTLYNETGSAATRVQGQWKLETDNNWTSLFDVSSAITSFTAPANTFSAGRILWQVRSYNTDGVAGDWGGDSSTAFVCFMAPDPPSGLHVDAVPFATISWQAATQDAYELTVDGEVVSRGFYEERTVTLDEPLTDGSHVFGVSVQGTYGLWSEVSTIEVTITNVSGAAVTLQGGFSIDASLGWTCSDADADFRIYRDGVRIGKTDAYSFLDRLSIGEHGYYVINRLSSGYYTKSIEVWGTTGTSRLSIALFPDGAWCEFPLTDVSRDQQSVSFEQLSSLVHVTGASFPFAEIGPYADRSVAFRCAVLTPADGRVLESMKGQVVIVKDFGQNMVIGVLSAISKIINRFYIGYSFTVKQCQYEDFRDESSN